MSRSTSSVDSPTVIFFSSIILIAVTAIAEMPQSLETSIRAEETAGIYY